MTLFNVEEMMQEFKNVKVWPMTHEALREISRLTGRGIARIVEDLADAALDKAQAAAARKLARRAGR